VRPTRPRPTDPGPPLPCPPAPRRQGARAALITLAWACSAPDPADRAPPAPQPPPADPLAPAAAPVAAPAPPAVAPPAAPAPPPPAVQPRVDPTPDDQLPEPPFTAYTAMAPLSPVGPGGAPAVHLKRLGVRVEVLQVLDHRTRVRCAGCGPEAADREVWIQAGRLRALRSPGAQADPLAAALRLRARWAAGDGLPDGLSARQACRLIDHGFTWTGDEARWELDGGLLRLRWDGERWAVAEATPPGVDPDWRCATARPPGPG
jgi:hypothetical protein